MECHGPTRPHPHTPHTGLLALVARRMWAIADRFWDAAEGRVRHGRPQRLQPLGSRRPDNRTDVG